MADKAPNITLYTTQTPNGIKISIALEELGLPYTVQRLDLSKSPAPQKEASFLAINPNGRIPALTDTFDDEKQIRLFESGSILQYLVATYDKNFKVSYPPGSREFYETNNWLFFQMAGLGPMQGQANHFYRYAPEKIEYGINRYINETRRLYGVLEKHLKDAGTPYLVGDKCTIADISHWGWIASAGWSGIDIDDFPLLKAWEDRMAARPGVMKGRDVPTRHNIKELIKDKAKADEVAKKASGWVMEGMKQDAEKQK